MHTFTVIVETLKAADATTAALALRDKLGLGPAEFEIVAVARGGIAFETVDEHQFALAPYSATSF